MKYNFLLSLSLIGLLFVACEKDEEEECHPCHIAFHMESNEDCCVEGGSDEDECCGVEEDDDHDHDHDHDEEISVPIGDFCGDDLVAAEAEGFVYTLAEDYVTTDADGETVTVPADDYGNGNMEIHCEEHADH